METGKRYLPAYDVIVVGSGMAGLMAGTRLAKAGKKVLMLAGKSVPKVIRENRICEII